MDNNYFYNDFTIMIKKGTCSILYSNYFSLYLG